MLNRLAATLPCTLAILLALFMVPGIATATVREYPVPDPVTVPQEGYAVEGGTVWGIKAAWLDKVAETYDVEPIVLDIMLPSQINGVTVTEIGAHAFEGDSWSSDKSAAGAVNYRDHPDHPKFIIGKIGLEDATSLKTIGTQAFNGCSDATGVLVLPDSVTEIAGNYAFGDCSSLTGIVWPENLTSINGGRIEDGKRTSSAFKGCTALRFATTKATYNAALVEGKVDDLNEVTFPDTLAVIGGMTFADAFVAGGNIPVTIPSSVEYMGSEAFCNKGGGTTPFSQITVLRSSSTQGAIDGEYDGVTGYEGNAFRWTGSAMDRVVILVDSATRDSFLDIYSGFSSFKKQLTYERALAFMNGSNQVASQQKLDGLSVSYVKDAAGMWSLDPGYALPALPDGADPSQGDCWKMGDDPMTTSTLVTEDSAIFYDSDDPVVSFEVEFTPKSGSRYTQTYQPGDTVTVDLSNVTRAEISAVITHPDYDPSKDDPWEGQHVYMQCQWSDPVTGDGSMSDGKLFKSEWNYGDSKTYLTINKVSQTRLDDDALRLTVRGLQSGSWGNETPASDTELFRSDKYALQIKVQEPQQVLDYLVMATEDGKGLLEDEYLSFLPTDVQSAIDHMSEKYDKAYAESTEYEWLYPEATWTPADPDSFDTSPGASNTFVWTVSEDVFKDAGWVVPADFPLSDKVNVHNPYIIKATANEGGSIEPAGDVVTPFGTSKTFTVTAADGYTIESIMVDGAAVDLSTLDGATDAEASYPFADIKSNHEIVASFKKKESPITPPPVMQTVTLTYAENGGNPLDDVTVTKGASAELATPVREGYTFEGWFYDVALTDAAGMGGTRITMSRDTTVYAKWSRTGVPDAFTTDHVNYVMGREAENGSRTIAPLDNITRAEVATMVFRLLKSEVRAEYLTTECDFPDVSSDAWYAEPVASLAAMDTIKGYPQDGMFHPDEPITRAELVTIVTRLDSRFEEGEWYGDLPFSDVPEGHWATNVLSFATNSGWLMGDMLPDATSKGTFRPDDSISRAETIAVFNRMLQRLPESTDDLLPGRVEWPDNQDESAWYWLAVEEATNNHDHEMKGDGVHERWTALKENIGW